MIHIEVIKLRKFDLNLRLVKILYIFAVLGFFLLFCGGFSFLVRAAEVNSGTGKAKVGENVVFTSSVPVSEKKEKINTKNFPNTSPKKEKITVNDLKITEVFPGLSEKFASDFSLKSVQMNPNMDLDEDFFNFSPPKTEKKEEVLRSFFGTITAYNSEVSQCDSSPCITANGYNVCKYGLEDTVAVNHLSFGTKVKIPEIFGDRVFIVRDRMNAKHSNRLDIWMLDKEKALNFGIKRAKIEVVE